MTRCATLCAVPFCPSSEGAGGDGECVAGQEGESGREGERETERMAHCCHENRDGYSGSGLVSTGVSR